MLVQQPSQQCLLLQIKESAGEARPKGHHTQDPCTTLDGHERQQHQQTHACTAGHTQHQHPSSCLCSKNTPYTATGGGINQHACTQLAQPAHHHSKHANHHTHTQHKPATAFRPAGAQGASTAAPHLMLMQRPAAAAADGATAMQLHACNHAPARCTRTCNCCKHLRWRPRTVGANNSHPKAAALHTAHPVCQ